MAFASRRDLLDYLVYLAVRVAVCALQCLSVESARAAGRTIGRIAYLVDGRHRRIAFENLRAAFGGRYSEPELRRLVRRVYEHFAQVAVEIALIPRKLHVANWKRYVRVEPSAAAMDLIVQDRAKILVSGHFGNWEMAGFVIAAVGLRPTSIARDLDNRFLHRYVQRLRGASGQKIVSKKGDFDRIEATLRRREALVSVADQSAGPRGCFVEFFGRPASTHKAIALLSFEHDAPIVVGYAYRDRPGFHYRMKCTAPLEPADYRGRADGVRDLTQDFTRALEEAIRSAPEQYFWLHRRWKHAPEARRRAA